MELDEHDIAVDFPFQLTFQHAPIDVRQMFELSEMLDFHEVRLRDPVTGLRVGLIVDLVELHRTETRIQAKPRGPMTYGQIASDVDLIVGEFRNRLGSAEVIALKWLIDRKGVASDARASHARVQ